MGAQCNSKQALAASAWLCMSPSRHLSICFCLLCTILAVVVQSVPSTFTTQIESSLHSGAPRLVLVQAVFRHGARTPLSSQYYNQTHWDICPSKYEGVDIEISDEHGGQQPPPILDPSTPQLPGSCSMGTLTSIGYEQAVELGRSIRDRYIYRYKFLPAEYMPGTLQAHTTSVRRTIATLKGLLTGLYPITQQPISVNAVKEEFEFMYGKNATCQQLGPLYESMQQATAEAGRHTMCQLGPLSHLQ